MQRFLWSWICAQASWRAFEEGESVSMESWVLAILRSEEDMKVEFAVADSGEGISFVVGFGGGLRFSARLRGDFLRNIACIFMDFLI